MPGSRLIIGLDYGTTYTGVSICEATEDGVQDKQSEVIRDWPSCHTKIGTKEKVPSEIAYLPNGIEWGANIPINAQREMWTKLQLDRPQSGEAGRILRELTSSTNAPRRRPVDIIADFLERVKDHLITNLDTQYGPELWRTLPITLVVTVPAVWSDLAKARTLQAVAQAGFNSVTLPNLKHIITATEPEAAAIYTIKTLRGGAQDAQLAVGDGFIVCDMGGGTVDLISYKVSKLQPTMIQEATVGNGDQCGGTFVDRAFFAWLQEKLGVEDFKKLSGGPLAAEIPRTSISQKLGRMLSDFIMEAKTGFAGRQDNYLRLPSPLSSMDDDEARGICDGEIEITSAEMSAMFQFPLERTCELLREQLNQALSYGGIDIKFIFMVGGFAESPFMLARVKEFGDSLGIQVVRPAFAWSAIVRGAAVKGLEVDGGSLVTNRKCRRHYGTDANTAFIYGKHAESCSYIDAFDGTKRASNQMDWLIKKGQNLSTSPTSCVKHSFYRTFWSGERRVSSLKLLASDQDEAASASTAPSIFKVATLDIDLNVIPDHEFKPMRTCTGRMYHRLDYEVEISVQSQLTFSLSVKGVKYSTLIANYET